MDAEKRELECSGKEGYCVLELPLGDSTEGFNLEKAVCSHGLFMMSPNMWDPISRTLSRPLRLPPPNTHDDDEADIDDAPYSLVVRISHPLPTSLRIEVLGVPCLSPVQRQSIRAQVSRMLRLSPSDNRMLRQYWERTKTMEEENCIGSFSGRIFRSPTLFEDMIKCILLCNCQWPRTLSMAESLCKLQWELYGGSFGEANVKAAAEPQPSIPKTPLPKDSGIKKRYRSVKTSASQAEMSAPSETYLENGEYIAGSVSQIGNFPSPRELATLDENLLARRCNLGYRAGRILKLAQGIVDGKIQFRRLVKASREPSLSDYDKLHGQLRQIDGFGPFTCANVLMCMGFYHVIPADSETIRHLKQIHRRTASIETVQSVVETIYDKYSPFQFLAYWAEVWHFYEQKFGLLSTLPKADYKLITGNNMRNEGHRKKKKIKPS